MGRYLMTVLFLFMQSNILVNLKLIKTGKRLTLGIQVGKLHLVRTTDYGSCYFFVME